jgi:hypothetical protein
LQRDASPAPDHPEAAIAEGCHACSCQAVARPSEVDQRRQTMATAEGQRSWSWTWQEATSQVANRQDRIYDI